MPRGIIRSIGVDWITLTTKDERRYEEWGQAFEAVAAQEQARGFKWVRARVLGYEGEQCGHAFRGRRADGGMLRLTSAAAQEYMWLFAPDACHCTRIDFQVTVELLDEPKPWLRKAYETAAAQRPKGGPTTRYTYIESSDGGASLLVGSRTSMRYGRIYDKGVEEKTAIPGRLWRYELEIKDDLADQAVALLVEGGENDRQMLAVLGEYFSGKSLPVLFTVPGGMERLKIPRVPIEMAGSLRWIAGPVANTFARLVETLGTEITLRALMTSLLQESTDSDIIPSIAALLEERRRSIIS